MELYKKEGRYSPEEGATEAAELKKKVESGEARNYSEAERKLEDEKFVTIQGLFGRYHVNREVMLEIVKKNYADFLDRGRSENDRSIVLDVYDRTIFNIARDFIGEVERVKHHDAFGPRNFKKPNLFDEISAELRKLEKDKESILAEYRKEKVEEKTKREESRAARVQAIEKGELIILSGIDNWPIDVNVVELKQWIQQRLDAGISKDDILKKEVINLALSLGRDNFEGVSLIIPLKEHLSKLIQE